MNEKRTRVRWAFALLVFIALTAIALVAAFFEGCRTEPSGPSGQSTESPEVLPPTE